MRRDIQVAVVGALLAAALAGCVVDPQQHALRDPEQKRLAQARMYGDYFDEAAANAVVRQATVYPYHFEPDTAHLTELGRHDLAILATRLRAYPGVVRVRRGGAPDELHEARAQAVLTFLREREVNPEWVTVLYTEPGGDGISSERVMDAIAKEKDNKKNGLDTFMLPVMRQGKSNGTSTTNTKSM